MGALWEGIWIFSFGRKEEMTSWVFVLGVRFHDSEKKGILQGEEGGGKPRGLFRTRSLAPKTKSVLQTSKDNTKENESSIPTPAIAAYACDDLPPPHLPPSEHL